MKKQIALALVTSLLLGLAGTTQAGDRSRGYPYGYPGGYDRNHYGGGRDYDSRYSRHRGHDHDDFGRGLAIVAGAVVLGTIISAISHSESRRTGNPYQPPVHDPNDRNGPPVRDQDYWYRVDQNGDCVLVRLNQQGREVWTYADASYCR